MDSGGLGVFSARSGATGAADAMAPADARRGPRVAVLCRVASILVFLTLRLAVFGGTAAAQSVATTEAADGAPFTDDPLVAGVTPVRAVHFEELRQRIDALRAQAGLSGFSWTDAVLTPGVTPVLRVHVTELRAALDAAYVADRRPSPTWDDAVVTAGATPIRARHVTGLRAAVVALETAPNRAPEVVDAVPARTLTVGEGAQAVDAAPYFDDPDRDPLTYEVASSDAGVVTARVSGSTVTLAPVAGGAATVTVTARDGEGLSASQTISVTVRGPDLAVGSPGASDATVEPGASFTLSLTVVNRGEGAAGATTLRAYRSSDAAISASDTQVGAAPVSGLAAGANEVASVTLTAPDSAGTYYYGGCVEPVAGESDTGNNCSAGVPVTVESPPPPPPPPPPSPEVLDATIEECSGGSAERNGETVAAYTVRFTWHARKNVHNLWFRVFIDTGKGEELYTTDFMWVSHIPAGQTSEHTIQGVGELPPAGTTEIVCSIVSYDYTWDP